MSDTWTVEKILKWTTGYFTEKGLDSPKLDAELLLAHTLGIDRLKLYMQWDRPLTPEELASYRALIKRRMSHEPVAYLTGTRAFWALDFACDKRALIPRSDTETLIDQMLEIIPDPKKNPDAGHWRVLDVGTGTGCIGITIAHERSNTDVTLVDIDAETLELARTNVVKLGFQDKITLLQSDLLSKVPGQWNVIVSNPPYIALNEKDLMGQDVLRHEPTGALFAGKDGLDIIRPLVKQAFSSLESGGWFLCEIGFKQGAAVQTLLNDAGFTNVKIRKDYGGNDRVVSGQRP